MSAVKTERYAAYKNSGVEWIGEVPEKWRAVRLKDLGFLQNGISKSGEYFGFGSPFVSYGNVYNNTISPEKIKTYANSTLEDQKFYSCRKGDVFFTRTSETIEEIGFSATCLKTIPKSVFSGFVIRFRPTSNKLTKEFSKFYFSANILRAFFCKEVAIVTRASLGQGLLNKLSVILPPIAEQTAIAAYLDTKTSQIDQQIDLLGQKAMRYGKLKQSLINETVTRGLDKSAPMKGSGVDWIGEVPEHWELKRVKEISKLVNGATPKSNVSENWDGELPWVTTDDLGKLNTKFITDTKRKITEQGYASCGTTMCPIGSVVISGRAPIGHIGILSISASSNQGCKTLVLNRKIANNLFVFYSLLSSKSKLEALGRGTTFIELSSKELGLFNLPLPSLPEQTAIATYLDDKTAQIDRIVTAINTQIDKLKDLRKALINDVVTGKIKVVSDGAAA